MGYPKWLARLICRTAGHLDAPLMLHIADAPWGWVPAEGRFKCCRCGRQRAEEAERA